MAPALPILSLAKLGRSPDAADSGASTYDYIIVGGGTAGCVLASRLSLLPGSPSVLVLERGIDVHKGWISGVPLLSTAWQADPDKAYSLPTVPQPGLDGRSCDLVAGKLLGGTSRMNSSLYTRGLPSEYDQWAKEFDLPSWSFDSLLPHFKTSQSHSPLPTVLPSPAPSSTVNASTGITGPWRTSTPSKINHAPVLPFLASAQKLGVPLVASLNDPEASANAVALHELTGDQGRRGSVLEFLVGEKGGFGGGLKIGLGALVRKLEIDAEGRCTGVWFSTEDEPESNALFASCSREVIVTAGALQSPQVLMLSGIGPKEDLEKHAIECKVDLPGVGQGLADHLGVYVPYSVPYADSLDRIETSPLHALSQLFSFFKSRTGAFTFQGSQGCIMSSSSRVDQLLSPTSVYSASNPLVTSPRDPNEIPNLEFLPLPIRYHSSLEDGKPDGKTIDLRKGKYDTSKGYFTPIVVLVKPRSTGSLKLASSNPQDKPLYDPQFLSDPADVAVLVKGMRFCKRLLREMKDSGYPVEPHGPNYPFHDAPGGQDRAETDEELEVYARKWANPAYHSSSTLRVSSPSDPLGVCDEQLRVRGVKGLRVADASVFPTVLAAHTQAAVVMVAEKCSSLLAEDWNMSRA